ncbi:unnamed protein product [Acanthoscelides obtectus]|uniref:Uncharacterized protein n=1 Tax=Acanthoscelides obtectus TaxID=200917 RepID=A0A9P0Q5I5_ACAOB|nr:unnamed protein product [Acanthoscelides obtectus]CAH2011704.1 unnamed protein product [Acanthoscelides obtectus]CAK1656440.1 hypothetical protein AOBTE_LOCUS19711 [Acanthoscelides obtectus]CAK1656444.1 hypothetical protein AOBTE_LOCUS19713 [Acanthoscelides obtectus]
MIVGTVSTDVVIISISRSCLRSRTSMFCCAAAAFAAISAASFPCIPTCPGNHRNFTFTPIRGAFVNHLVMKYHTQFVVADNPASTDL